MNTHRLTALVLMLAIALIPLGAAAQEALLEAELNRAQLFGFISDVPGDMTRPVTPRAGLMLAADALALALGARDASFDKVAQAAPDEGALPVREYCMALSRAGERMGVPARCDLAVPQDFSGTIGRSSYFATKDAPYQAPGGNTYENELLYSVAFCCGTLSTVTGLPLLGSDALVASGVDAPVTWAQAVAGALRLYEAVPPAGELSEAQDASGAQDSPVQSPDPEADAGDADDAALAPKYAWIEILSPLVNIRDAAALDANILSQASQGERYRSFGLTQEDWYVIEYVEGGIGYISGEYCAPVEHTEVAAGETIGTVTVLTAASYVRATPSNSGRKIYTARRGQSFECLGQEGNGWYRVRLSNGRNGYIYHKNCALSWFD